MGASEDLFAPSFDRRVVPGDALALVRECQALVPCHLGGGAVLSGAWLRHRLSRDLDLFCHDREQHRQLVTALPDLARSAKVVAELRRDSGTFARMSLTLADREMELDLVFEPTRDLEPAASLEGVLVESPTDLRASKLTCILSRSEPRDLVDLLFLERAGFDPTEMLALAVKKDAGIDPAILAWLLRQFPVEPMPLMLEPLSTDELRSYRDALAERMRGLALPRGGSGSTA
jgi:hypothetical protein